MNEAQRKFNKAIKYGTVDDVCRELTGDVIPNMGSVLFSIFEESYKLITKIVKNSNTNLEMVLNLSANRFKNDTPMLFRTIDLVLKTGREVERDFLLRLYNTFKDHAKTEYERNVVSLLKGRVGEIYSPVRLTNLLGCDEYFLYIVPGGEESSYLLNEPNYISLLFFVEELPINSLENLTNSEYESLSEEVVNIFDILPDKGKYTAVVRKKCSKKFVKKLIKNSADIDIRNSLREIFGLDYKVKYYRFLTDSTKIPGTENPFSPEKVKLPKHDIYYALTKDISEKLVKLYIHSNSMAIAKKYLASLNINAKSRDFLIIRLCKMIVEGEYVPEKILNMIALLIANGGNRKILLVPYKSLIFDTNCTIVDEDRYVRFIHKNYNTILRNSQKL